MHLTYAGGLDALPLSMAMSPPLLLVWLGSQPSETLIADWLQRLADAGHGGLQAVHGEQLLNQAGAIDAPQAVMVLSEAAPLLQALGRHGAWPRGPISLFGPPPAPAQAEALLAAGLSGWWPDGLDAPALAAALALDQARWQLQAEWRREVERVRAQLDERKWVDRAKGVLMTARGIGENEAFTMLRGAAMHANLRMGELSRSVTEAALWADALNRAGQLRMLSQRLVKLAVQRWSDLDARSARTAQDEAFVRLADNLAHLQALPVPQDAAAPWAMPLAVVQQSCEALREALAGRLGAAMLRRVDERAEAVLQAAEALSTALETASGRRALHIINLCGRQRMRVQRVAKQALLAQLLGDAERQMALPPLLDDFEAALRELDAAPLSSTDIRDALRASHDEWLRLLRGLHGLQQAPGRLALAQASDALLALFDRLTASYEHSLQVIMA
jgi:AmiR/NasT family two-component response regulator